MGLALWHSSAESLIRSCSFLSDSVEQALWASIPDSHSLPIQNNTNNKVFAEPLIGPDPYEITHPVTWKRAGESWPGNGFVPHF